jgi:hypothetical protein
MSCPKCGSNDKGIAWHESKWGYAHGCRYGDVERPDREHLHYYCRLCRFDWTGPTRDQLTNG